MQAAVGGKIVFPPFKATLDTQLERMDPSFSDLVSKCFGEHIWIFNSMFAMTSHGEKIAYGVMKWRGPYTLCMNVYGSLMPIDEVRPRYASLYI